MMSRFLVLVFACLLTGQAQSAEPPYLCKSFAEDYKRLTETSTDPGNSKFSYGVGFLIGTYQAKTEAQDIDGEIAGLAKFEKRVIEECKKSPEKRPSIVILSLANSLEKHKPKLNETKYEQISVTDFQLDSKKLTGKLVEVTGVVQFFSGIVLLGEKRFSTNKIHVEYESLPREQRKYIIENCESGCEMTIRGKASKVTFEIGIIADDATPN